MADRSSARDGDRSGGKQRGAALVEMAIVIPLLMMIVFGIVNYGLLFKDNLTIQSAARSGARVGAQQASNASADWQIVRTVEAAVAKLGNKETLQVIVFKADDANGDVPEACVTGGTGIPGVCNVYGEADLAMDEATFVAPANVAAHQWEPTTRNATTAAADYLGVWIKVRHDDITGLFDNQITTTKSVFRLAPVVDSDDTPVLPTTTTSSSTSTTSTTVNPHAYIGQLEAATCGTEIRGWALDTKDPGPIDVDVYVDGTLVSTVLADEPHPLHDGHGWHIATPSSVNDVGGRHEIEAKIHANDQVLTDSPITVGCTYDGQRNQITCSNAAGWALTWADLSQQVTVKVTVINPDDGSIVGTNTGVANLNNSFWTDTGLPTPPTHGFDIALPPLLGEGWQHWYKVSASIEGSNPEYFLPKTVSSSVQCGHLPGHIDDGDIDCFHVSGWAADKDFPDNSADIDIWINGTFIETINAGDFWAGSPGNQMHGFTWSIPSWVRTGPQGTYGVDVWLHQTVKDFSNLLGWFGAHSITCGVAPPPTTTTTTAPAPTTTTSTPPTTRGVS
jgi:hypothetical protein